MCIRDSSGLALKKFYFKLLRKLTQPEEFRVRAVTNIRQRKRKSSLLRPMFLQEPASNNKSVYS